MVSIIVQSVKKDQHFTYSPKGQCGTSPYVCNYCKTRLK